jgi:hypothetical protein
MKIGKKKLAPEVPCPTCGAMPGKRCRTTTGLLRHEPHLNRRLEVKDRIYKQSN